MWGNGVIIFLVIVVLSAIIGAVSQVLKNQQQGQQAKAARGRADVRAGNRAGKDDVDRFLEEIDKLRSKKPEDKPRTTRTAPVVAKRAAPAKARPIAATPVARSASARSVEQLPIAPIVSLPTTPVVSRTAGKAKQPLKNDFARQMSALLSSKHGVPAAFVMQEVFGPPKCRKGM